MTIVENAVVNISTIFNYYENNNSNMQNQCTCTDTYCACA